MLGLTILDIIVIAVYFAVMIGIGFWSMKRIKNQEDYFLGGRRFGKLIQIFANFGQATSSDTGPSVATTTYHNGAAGVWSALLMLFATPFYWFIAPLYRRMRCITLGDFYADRYNSKGLGGAYSLIMGFGLCIMLSLSFIMIIKTVQAMTPKPVSEFSIAEHAEYEKALRLGELESLNHATLSQADKNEMETLRASKPRKTFSYINKYILVFSIVFVVCIYSILGGLEAAFLSDMLQGLFILLLSVMLIPFAIARINSIYGGEGVMDAFRTLHAQKSMAFFDIFGSPAAIDFTWYYIAALSVMALINSGAQANGFVTPSSSKDEFSARFGMTFGLYLKRFTTVLWGLTSMFAVLLFADKITDPDLLWGYASKELLGPLNMGLVGLMIAALMAALMSTADMFMITAAGLFTHSVYRPLFPSKSEKHYVTVGRSLGGLVVIGGAMLALFSDSLLGVLKLWWEFGSLFAAGMWMGILWKRTTAKAVWAQMSLALVLFFLIPIFLPVLSADLRTNEYLLKRTDPAPLTRQYPRASGEDVVRRKNELKLYQALSETEKSKTEQPALIKPGQSWEEIYQLPRKGVFWTGGVKFVNNDAGEGTYQGKGMLNILLVAIDSCGWDLSKNPYALNETIRVLIRVLLPFGILIICSLIFPRSREEEIAANKTCAKLLTPLADTPEEDDAKVEQVMNNPQCYDHLKIFGSKSNWQFIKWSREGTIGFIINIGVVLAITGLLFFIVNLGA